MTVFTIVAVSENNVIGVENKLPWHLPIDLKWFKMNTLHGAIIMGRRTWDSLPKKPLPDRINIVLSRKEKPRNINAHWYNQLKTALEYSTLRHRNTYVIGGSEIFKLAMHVTDIFLVTRVHTVIEHPNTTTFIWPTDIERIWHSPTMEQNGIAFHFEMYRHKSLSCDTLCKILEDYGL